MFRPLIRLGDNCLDLSQTAVIFVNQDATEGLRGHDFYSLIKMRIHDLQTGSHDDKRMGKIFRTGDPFIVPGKEYMNILKTVKLYPNRVKTRLDVTRYQLSVIGFVKI